MANRPLVSVFSNVGHKAESQIPLPAVFTSPIRSDVVHDVHRDMSKNRRQPISVSSSAGMQSSAESWGTGRAVSRIPRVPGGGTHRSGQGAFGNMCRGGRMFAPTKVYRRWGRRINKNQKRYAVVSALAASASAPLVQARGHRITQVPEIPLVVSDKAICNLTKTKQAVKLLQHLRAYGDVEKVKVTRKVRAGQGKSRNRRYRQRKGPLVVYDQRSEMCYAFRNLPGIELCSVNSLSLLSLAPGGHLGRFIIWTEGAFQKLNYVFGTLTEASQQKRNYFLPAPMMTISDLSRIIQAPEVQKHLRPTRTVRRVPGLKKNPLKNLGVMLRLNPYAKTVKRNAILQQERALFRNKVFTAHKNGQELPQATTPVEKHILNQVVNTKKHKPIKRGKAKKTWIATLLS
jgi:large subunit ribosomal protein L4e